MKLIFVLLSQSNYYDRKFSRPILPFERTRVANCNFFFFKDISENATKIIILYIIIAHNSYSVNMSKFRSYFDEGIVFESIIGADTVVNQFVRNDTTLIVNFCYNKWLISTKSQPDVCIPMIFLITSPEVSVNRTRALQYSRFLTVFARVIFN